MARHSHRLAVACSLATACLLGAACASQPPQSGTGGDGGVGNNRAPHIDPVDPVQVNEGETLHIVFVVTDPDGDTLFLDAAPLPDGAFFDPVQGTLTYSPDFDVVTPAEGTLTLPDITVTVDDRLDPNDPARLQASATVSITVVHVNQVPLFLASDGGRLTQLDAHVDPASEEQLPFQAIDLDDDPLTLRLTGSPAYARLDDQGADKFLVLSPTEADRGSVAEFAIDADDGTDTATLPVRVVVGNLEAELPAPEGLTQTDPDGAEVAVGGSAFEGSFIFGVAPHDFQFGPLRLQVEVAELEQSYDDGDRAIGAPVEAGDEATVELPLSGGTSYHWEARWLSDEFGAGPPTLFGDNPESAADVVVSIVPQTTLDDLPHDPSPPDLTFGYYSSNVADFECLLDDGDWADCSTRVTCCNGSDCGTRTECSRTECTCAQHTLIGLDVGHHSFSVRGVTHDGLADPTPETFAWDVLDVAPPDTFLSSTPPAPVGCTAEFRFTSDDASATYECRLDRTAPVGHIFQGNYLPCASPKDYNGLETGDYTFMVRAVNLVGVSDDTPQSFSFSTTCTGGG